MQKFRGLVFPGLLNLVPPGPLGLGAVEPPFGLLERRDVNIALSWPGTDIGNDIGRPGGEQGVPVVMHSDRAQGPIRGSAAGHTADWEEVTHVSGDQSRSGTLVSGSGISTASARSVKWILEGE